jgi:choline-sulfatase
MKRSFVIIGSLLFVGLVGCSLSAHHLKPNPYNILWLTGESIRPDHLHVYGYERETSPNLDGFARTGVIFKNAFNPSGWTSENMVSVLTGINSLVHGVDTRSKSVPSLWYMPLKLLRDRGYTVSRIQSFQNISNYDYLGLEIESGSEDLVEWLTKHQKERFFIWYHLLQAHLPYTAPEVHKNLYWNDAYVQNVESKRRVKQVLSSSLVVRGEATFLPEDQTAIWALYDGSVHYMDAEFGRIIKAVEELGLLENTIIVYSADHGEELLDHGFVGHASTGKGGHLHDEITHVPLMISSPKMIPQNKVVETQVRGLDIIPTLFDLLGLPPQDYFEGNSLLPVIRGEDTTDRIAYASSSYRGYQEKDPEHVVDYMRAVRQKNWKLFYRLWGLKDEEFFLYNLADDPKELKDVKTHYPEKFAELKQLMDDWTKQARLAKVPLESGHESLWVRLIRWFDETFSGKRKEELIARASSPPKIQLPLSGAILSYAKTRGKVRLEWDGFDGVPYLVDISAGQGEKIMEVQFKTDKPFIEREVTEAYWKEYILLYQPVRVRVKINRSEHRWSEWQTIKMK